MLYSSLFDSPSEIIQHTHFKIDNISSSTRFEELPEEAQKELDELERYIFSQGQKSEYMKIHSIPRQAQMMDKCRKDTESLSQVKIYFIKAKAIISTKLHI